MVQKSYGKMRGSRKKMRNPVKQTLTQLLRKFAVGDKVHIALRSSGSFQNPKFHGKTGTILAKAGRSYLISVTDGNATKRIYLEPEHLELEHLKNSFSLKKEK